MKRSMPSIPQSPHQQGRAGKIKYALALWLLGAPMFLVIIALFTRGCDF
jgi:hypothetical protein